MLARGKRDCRDGKTEAHASADDQRVYASAWKKLQENGQRYRRKQKEADVPIRSQRADPTPELATTAVLPASEKMFG